MQSLTSSRPVAVAPPNEQEVMRCLVVILRKRDTDVLVSGRAPGYRLPSIEVPARQRIAPNLLPGIERYLGMRTVGRFCVVPELRNRPAYSVVDAIGSCAPAGHAWLPVSAIPWDNFAPDAQATLWSALARIHAYAAGKLAGRFVAAGWLEEIRAWTEDSLAGSGLRLGEVWSQYSLGPDYALLRFSTSGPAVWFKAVGAECAREFAITEVLSAAAVPHIPRVLAFQEDWRAWLSIEAAGRRPDEQTAGAQWETAARSLSEFQMGSIPCTGYLLAAGGRDLRARCLHGAIELCLSRMGALMKMQPRVPPVALGAAEFLTIAAKLKEACLRLDALRAPDTAGHSDFSAGNISIGESDTVFLDWAECHVGPPFITLAYLELLAGAPRCRRRAREAYLELWRREWPAKQIDELLALCPLLAVFACVLGCDDPTRTPEELDSDRARRLRSLTRRMHLEARALPRPGSR